MKAITPKDAKTNYELFRKSKIAQEIERINRILGETNKERVMVDVDLDIEIRQEVARAFRDSGWRVIESMNMLEITEKKDGH